MLCTKCHKHYKTTCICSDATDIRSHS